MNARHKKVELLTDDALLFATFPHAKDAHLATVLRELAPGEFVVHTYNNQNDSYSQGDYVNPHNAIADNEMGARTEERARAAWCERVQRVAHNYATQIFQNKVDEKKGGAK